MANYLNYDDQGFIVGTKRIESGIALVHDDTQEIIKILKSQNQINNTLMNRIAQASERAANQGRLSARVQGVAQNHSYQPVERQKSGNTGQSKAVSAGSHSPILNSASASRSKLTSNAIIETVVRDSRTANSSANTSVARNRGGVIGDESGERVANSQSSARPNTNQGDGARRSNNPTGKNGREKKDKDRDEKGRFTAKEKSMFDSLSKMASKGSGSGRGGIGGSGDQVDPLIESMREIKGAVSPVASALGTAGKFGAKAAFKAGKFSYSKYKSLKRKEPLPKDQQRHNKQNEETLGEILKRMSAGKGGSLLDNLGGFFGRGKGKAKGGKGRGLGKGLRGAGRGLGKLGGARFLGPIATAIGIGSLASQWGGMDDKQKAGGVGSLAGGTAGAAAGAALGTALIPIPVVGTAVGAAVGGWLGSEGGEEIGSAATPHIKNWTDSLKKYELGNKLEAVFKIGMQPFFATMLGLGGTFSSWVGTKLSDVLGSIGFGGGTSQIAVSASDYAIKHAATQSLKACALYVNNAFRAQGLKASGHGVDAADNLMELNPNQFERVQYDDNYMPKVGDVMSMPSHKSAGHGYGHVAIYTAEGWVSDYKQGEKYGNTAAPNKKYYEAIKGGQIKPTIVRPVADSFEEVKPQTADARTKRDQAMKYFMSKGWTKEQAAGIAANLQAESSWRSGVTGDLDKKQTAYGLAQWRGSRQQDFKRVFGKDIKNSTFSEQLAFVDWELKNTEKNAGNRLKQANNPAQAAKVVAQDYERPQDTEGAKAERARIANSIYKNYKTGNQHQTPAQLNKGGAFGMGDYLKSQNNFMPATTVSGMRLPGMSFAGVSSIPDMPAVKMRLNSGSDKPIVMQSNNDNIGQNVSDRGLAHAITGGLGENRYWG